MKLDKLHNVILRSAKTGNLKIIIQHIITTASEYDEPGDALRALCEDLLKGNVNGISFAASHKIYKELKNYIQHKTKIDREDKEKKSGIMKMKINELRKFVRRFN